MKGTYDKVAFTKSKKELTKVINCGLLYRMTGIRWPAQGTRALLQTERVHSLVIVSINTIKIIINTKQKIIQIKLNMMDGDGHL